MGEAVSRTGIGFDVHRFDVDRPLMLGGIEMEGHGLAGHSDGDVVCHALADALLGAGALGDVGSRFPDSDPTVAGIAGVDLLARTVAILREAGVRPSSVDVSIIAERPQVEPHRDAMRGRIATALGIEHGKVSVKATRPEGLGLQGDGIGCIAVAVIV